MDYGLPKNFAAMIQNINQELEAKGTCGMFCSGFIFVLCVGCLIDKLTTVM